MVPMAAMTNDELMAYLQTRGLHTDAEVVLLERLITAIDEIDALVAQVKDQQDLLGNK